jgi:hypothetical protein
MSMFKETAQDRILNRFAAKHRDVTASIHDYEQCSNTLFKVVATFSDADVTADRLSLAIAASLGNEFSVVEGSFRTIPKSGVPSAVGFVRANRHSMEATESALAGMQVMAGNILMSKEDESLWEIRSSGDAKYLVRQAQDDLSGLVALARVRTINVPKLSAIATMSPSANKEVIAYVDVESEEVVLAAVLGTVQDKDGNDMILAYAGGEDLVINPALMVESAFVGEAIKEIAAERGYDLPADLNSKDGQKKYWDVLFQYDTGYATMLKQMVDQHAAA